jgi:hypothetical protein
MLTAQAGGPLPESAKPSVTTEAVVALWLKLDRVAMLVRMIISPGLSNAC